MRPLVAAVAAAFVTAVALAFASGGPPPTEAPSPEVRTIVTHGTARLHVATPARRSNATIERAVRRARAAAFPTAVAAARREATALAAAARLRLAGPLGAARDASPYGFWDPDTGRFGPGKWCGRIFTRRDGVRRSHRGCPVPRDLTVRITVTFGVR